MLVFSITKLVVVLYSLVESVLTTAKRVGGLCRFGECVLLHKACSRPVEFPDFVLTTTKLVEPMERFKNSILTTTKRVRSLQRFREWILSTTKLVAYM